MRRRRDLGATVLLVLLAAMTTTPSAVSGETVSVPQAVDLRADGRLAEETGRPLMLVITREHCGYCALLKRAVIVPMIISGEYDHRIIVREVMIDQSLSLVDFAGREVSPFAVANRYEALLTPVVLLVGPTGEELDQRLIGISNEEMYLFYLDRAIERATAKLHALTTP